MICVKEIKITFLRTQEGSMSVIYGYARCSTDESRQDVDRQKRELFSMGVQEDKHIYWEYESGTKTDRVELSKLLDFKLVESEVFLDLDCL